MSEISAVYSQEVRIANEAGVLVTKYVVTNDNPTKEALVTLDARLTTGTPTADFLLKNVSLTEEWIASWNPAIDGQHGATGKFVLEIEKDDTSIKIKLVPKPGNKKILNATWEKSTNIVTLQPRDEFILRVPDFLQYVGALKELLHQIRVF